VRVAATIRDVASAAGVSPATVSRVLNGRLEVAEDLRRRVTAAIEQLGYRPNGAARSLRTRATMVLGIMISDITNPFFTAMVRGAEDAAQRSGYSVVLANTDEDLDKEHRYLQIAVAEQMAGVVIAPASSTRTDISPLTRSGIPVVTVDRQLRKTEIDSVTINNYRAAREATEHLASEGGSRIAFISGPAKTTTGERRLAGFKAALAATGLEYAPSMVQKADFRVQGGYVAANTLLSQRQRPDALLVSNNLMALGALQAIHDVAMRVPDDLLFASFDGIPWARALRPTLTVVEQPTYQIGREAVQLLLSRIAGGSGPPRKVVLPAELSIGESSRRH
jgi:LacI family transcriptional regulator